MKPFNPGRNRPLAGKDRPAFIRGLPKAELHIHIEGALEPELVFALAAKNEVALTFNSVEDLRGAYDFNDLQSFLDIYYQGARVLVSVDDFFNLGWAYLQKAQAQNVRHAEIFFDPQTHTGRGIPFGTVLTGIDRALERGRVELGLSSALIMCFMRHLGPEEARRTLSQALPYRDRIAGVGLDSTETGYPPRLFTDVFKQARQAGFATVAHAGEEGPPDYIRQALELLGAARIDHGVRCLEDEALTVDLARRRVPLTVCPLSNVKLRVFENMAAHNVKTLIDRGLCVTINSDDPAYFGGYINENYLAVGETFDLGLEDLYRLAKNSFTAAFIAEDLKQAYVDELDRYAAGFV